jgi:hypothetical protein
MLAKTTAALNHARTFPDVTADPQLRQLLAHHLIVLAVAEAEASLEDIIIEYFETTTTIAARNLAKSSLSSLLRSHKTSEISGFLARLGEEYKARFQVFMKEDEALETKYNNLVVGRHGVVHRANCNVTFEEFQDSLASIVHICTSVKRALHGG